MSKLTTETTVKTYLGFSGDRNDSLIGALIEDVSYRVADYCDRVFEEEANKVEYPVGGTGVLMLKNYPITSIASIYEDSERSFGAGTLVNSSEYYSAGDAAKRGLVIREASWKRELSGSYHNRWLPGIDIIKVTYTGGYSVGLTGYTAVPEALSRLVAKQVAYLFNRRKALGISSASGGEGSQSFISDYDFLPEVKKGLQAYRRLTAT